MKTVQVHVIPWDGELGRWADAPIAFTQMLVAPRGNAVGNLFKLAPVQDRRGWDAGGEKLAPGRYFLKAYLDSQDVLTEHPEHMLKKETAVFLGAIEIQAQWREGFPEAEVVEGSEFAEP